MLTKETMKKQRLAALLGSAVLAVLLTACGGDDSAGSGESVEDRLKPIGTVNVAGKATPAAPEAAPSAEPAKEEAAAPAAEPAKEEVAAAPAAEAAPAAIDGEAVYKKACLACHLAGVGGAPKPGDKAGWEPRLAKGMDVLMASAINGIPGTAMPPRGTCAACSDEELKAAIEFMIGN